MNTPDEALFDETLTPEETQQFYAMKIGVPKEMAEMLSVQMAAMIRKNTTAAFHNFFPYALMLHHVMWPIFQIGVQKEFACFQHLLAHSYQLLYEQMYNSKWSRIQKPGISGSMNEKYQKEVTNAAPPLSEAQQQEHSNTLTFFKGVLDSMEMIVANTAIPMAPPQTAGVGTEESQASAPPMAQIPSSVSIGKNSALAGSVDYLAPLQFGLDGSSFGVSDGDLKKEEEVRAFLKRKSEGTGPTKKDNNRK